jgi:hypothetical protein
MPAMTKTLRSPASRIPPVLAAALLLVTACVPTDRSVVTKDVQVFDAAVVGAWQALDRQFDPRVTIGKHADGRSYTVVARDDQGLEASRGVLRIMKLGDDRFYELETRNTGDPKTRFAIGRLKIEKDLLTGYSFPKDSDILDHPDVKTIEVADEADGTGKQKVISMEPAKVQAFLNAHAKEMSKQTMQLKRVK